MSLSDKGIKVLDKEEYFFKQKDVREFIEELKSTIIIETMTNKSRTIEKNIILKKIDKLAGKDLT